MSAHRPGVWEEEEKQQQEGPAAWFQAADSSLLPYSRAQGRSYLDAYFVFPNGTALTLNELSS